MVIQRTEKIPTSSLIYCFTFLCISELISCQNASKTFKKIIDQSEHTIWKKVCERDYPNSLAGSLPKDLISIKHSPWHYQLLCKWAQAVITNLLRLTKRDLDRGIVNRSSHRIYHWCRYIGKGDFMVAATRQLFDGFNDHFFHFTQIYNRDNWHSLQIGSHSIDSLAIPSCIHRRGSFCIRGFGSNEMTMSLGGSPGSISIEEEHNLVKRTINIIIPSPVTCLHSRDNILYVGANDGKVRIFNLTNIRHTTCWNELEVRFARITCLYTTRKHLFVTVNNHVLCFQRKDLRKHLIIPCFNSITCFQIRNNLLYVGSRIVEVFDMSGHCLYTLGNRSNREQITQLKVYDHILMIAHSESIIFWNLYDRSKRVIVLKNFKLRDFAFNKGRLLLVSGNQLLRYDINWVTSDKANELLRQIQHALRMSYSGIGHLVDCLPLMHKEGLNKIAWRIKRSPDCWPINGGPLGIGPHFGLTTEEGISSVRIYRKALKKNLCFSENDKYCSNSSNGFLMMQMTKIERNIEMLLEKRDFIAVKSCMRSSTFPILNLLK